MVESDEFAHLFREDSVAEVAITGTMARPDGTVHVISGQIDRLVIADGVVSIVDYKSNRPPPDRAEDVTPVYLRQMATYRHVIRDAWPDHAVRAFLLWTDAPRLMALPDSLLDTHLPGLHTQV